MRFYLPALIVIVLDQVTKQFFAGLARNFEVIGDWVRITLVHNSGAAFGMFQGGRIFLIISSVVASIFIIVLASRAQEEERSRLVYLGLILGGAIGNLIDRIYPGYVIDFIDMGIGSRRWPVYNFADAAVTIGGILLILTFSRKKEVKEEEQPAPESATGDLGESTTG